MQTLVCAKHTLDLSRPVVMGILNVTPDSFSDGGNYFSLQQAEQHALAMQQQGAGIIDVGGESTRPGAQAVSVQEELDRVIPIIERLTDSLQVPVSIDTSKAEVMREAVMAGAGMINDVMALRGDNVLTTVGALDQDIAVCLMHMQGEPRTMQNNPSYDDVVSEVSKFLAQRVTACEQAGIDRQRLVLDPGFGFGKTLEHNLALLAGLDKLTKQGLPLLAGISRKSMIGTLLDNAPVEARINGSVAAAVMAFERGARLLRVHDVGPTVEALKITQAVMQI